MIHALQQWSTELCSTVNSVLVLWQLPVVLYIVHWVFKTVVQLLVAMHYNIAHDNIFLGHGTNESLHLLKPHFGPLPIVEH